MVLPEARAEVQLDSLIAWAIHRIRDFESGANRRPVGRVRSGEMHLHAHRRTLMAPTGVPLDGFVPGKCIYTHTGGR